MTVGKKKDNVKVDLKFGDTILEKIENICYLGSMSRARMKVTLRSGKEYPKQSRRFRMKQFTGK